MTMPKLYTGADVPNTVRFPRTPSNSNETTTTTSSSTTSSSTVQFCQELEEEMLRNHCERLRMQYAACIGQEMTPAILKRLLLSLYSGTPWQYYEYALEEATYAPYPSWRYVMAIVNRLIGQGVPVDQIRAKKPVRQSYKTVEQQQYTQREYHHTDDAMDAMMASFMAMQKED